MVATHDWPMAASHHMVASSIPIGQCPGRQTERGNWPLSGNFSSSRLIVTI